MESRESTTREQSEELVKYIDKEELQKVIKEAEKCRYTIESSVPYNPMRVSDLTVTDFNRMLRDIVREEIERNLPIYTVPKYEGFEVPRTPGELNDNSEFNVTDHTVLKSDKFPG